MGSYKATELENEWIFELVTSEVKVSFSSCSMGEMGRTRKVITRPKIEIKPRGFPHTVQVCLKDQCYA